MPACVNVCTTRQTRQHGKDAYLKTIKVAQLFKQKKHTKKEIGKKTVVEQREHGIKEEYQIKENKYGQIVVKMPTLLPHIAR